MIWLVTVAVVGLFIRRQPRLAIFLIVAGVGALVLDPSLKTLVGRLRPVVDVPIAQRAGQQLPERARARLVRRVRRAAAGLPAGGAAPVAPARDRADRRDRAADRADPDRARRALRLRRLAGWLLGAAWLGATLYAFRLWRREGHKPLRPVGEGLEPEAAHEIAPAPDERKVLPHPLRRRSPRCWSAGCWCSARCTRSACSSATALDGTWVGLRRHRGDRVVRRRCARPRWDGPSFWASKAGDTHAILAVTARVLPAGPRVLAALAPGAVRRAGDGGRADPLPREPGGGRPPASAGRSSSTDVPTGSYPSGHIAATLCLWVAIAILVMPRTDRWWRWITVVLAVVMPLVVAASRVYRGMHHPTDIVGALILHRRCGSGCSTWSCAPTPTCTPATGRPTRPTSTSSPTCCPRAHEGHDLQHQDRGVRRERLDPPRRGAAGRGGSRAGRAGAAGAARLRPAAGGGPDRGRPGHAGVPRPVVVRPAGGRVRAGRAAGAHERPGAAAVPPRGVPGGGRHRPRAADRGVGTPQPALARPPAARGRPARRRRPGTIAGAGVRRPQRPGPVDRPHRPGAPAGAAAPGPAPAVERVDRHPRGGGAGPGRAGRPLPGQRPASRPCRPRWAAPSSPACGWTTCSARRPWPRGCGRTASSRAARPTRRRTTTRSWSTSTSDPGPSAVARP